MLGRLFHYSVDAALVSALLAGIKRSSGFTPDLDRLQDPTMRSIAERYLGFGEFVFDSSLAAARASQLFGKASLLEQAGAALAGSHAQSSASGVDVQQQQQPPRTSGGGWFK